MRKLQKRKCPASCRCGKNTPSSNRSKAYSPDTLSHDQAPSLIETLVGRRPIFSTQDHAAAAARPSRPRCFPGRGSARRFTGPARFGPYLRRRKRDRNSLWTTRRRRNACWSTEATKLKTRVDRGLNSASAEEGVIKDLLEKTCVRKIRPLRARCQMEGRVRRRACAASTKHRPEALLRFQRERLGNQIEIRQSLSCSDALADGDFLTRHGRHVRQDRCATATSSGRVAVVAESPTISIQNGPDLRAAAAIAAQG